MQNLFQLLIPRKGLKINQFVNEEKLDNKYSGK